MSTTAIRVGCAGFGPGIPARSYFKLDAVELLQSFYFPPRPATLRRWREAAPPDFCFVVRVWQLVTHEASSPGYRQLPARLPQPFSGSLEGAGHLRDNELVQHALARTQETAEALGAAALLFETPSSFTPTAAHRRALARFFESCPRQGRRMVWHPAGLWSLDEVLPICHDLQLTPCWDPFVHLEVTIPAGLEALYLRPLGLGAGQRYSEAQLSGLAAQLAGPSDLFCVFGSPLLFGDASRLHRLLAGR